MTDTSASVYFAIMEIVTDLPTPDPEKMPIRWPWHVARKVFIARTPKSNFPPIRVRSFAGGGEFLSGIGRSPCGKGPFPSKGSPSALITRPNH